MAKIVTPHMSNEQYLTSAEMNDILELQTLLDTVFNPLVQADRRMTITPGEIKLYDSNGELVGTVALNHDTKGYVFQYPAPEDTP